MMTDFTKSPEQILIDLINGTIGSKLRPDQLVLGTPEPATGSDALRRNTNIVVQGVPAKGTMGHMEILYNRVNINTVPGSRPRVFPLGAMTQLSELVALINTAYNINLTLQDYEDGVLPDVGANSLVMLPGSLTYVGALSYEVTADVGVWGDITNAPAA